MLSSAGSLEESHRSGELGIALHLVKPVKQSDLFDAISRVLSACETHVDARAPMQDAPLSAPRRVLVADDGAVNQQVARQLLEARGYSVVVVNNGREAVVAFEKSSFDVVLMDVQMPEMDGFEATKAIRDMEQITGGRTPIIAMTANALKGDRERCLQAGMDDYLTKPIQSKALYAVVENVVVTRLADIDEPVETDGSDSVMDWQAALSRMGGREDLLRQMVPIFFKEAAERLPALRDAIDRQDSDNIRRLAHGLKGSASCFSADAAVSAALTLELMAQEGDLAGALDAYALLEHEIERLKDALIKVGEAYERRA
jgi:CheY-like chemotaxis protein